MKARYMAEKKIIEEALASGGELANNPPKEPYLVETDEPLVASLLTDMVSKLEFKDLIIDYQAYTDIHIETASKLSMKALEKLTVGLRNGKVDCFLAPEEYPHLARADFESSETPVKVLVEYPIEQPALFMVDIPIRRHVCFGQLIWAICQAYRKLYTDPKRHGIWGHALEDLVIEGIEMDTKLLTIIPMIGS